MKVLVVLPTYNEAENIDTVLPAIRKALPECSVLVVDDGSPDGTAAIAERLGTEIGEIHVLRRTEKSGLGSAYRAGFAWGMEKGYDVCIEMDADLSHDPAALPDLVGGIDAGADLVIGSRYVPGGTIPKWAWHRRLISRGGNLYAAAVLGLGVEDSTAGFRAYRTSLLGKLDLEAIRADGYGFQIEMTYRTRQAGGEIVEVPINFVDRVKGESKMSTHIVAEAFLLVTWWGIQRVLSGRRRSRRTVATR